MTVVSITAHRNTTQDDDKIIYLAMTTLMCDPGIEAIYFGGARGGDTVSLKAAIEIRGLWDNIPELVVVVPDRIEDQPRIAREWILKADRVIELKNPITPSDQYRSYDIRNEYLVNVAQKGEGFIVAFWNSKPSGTANCVGFAKAMEVPVQVVAISGGLKCV